MGSQSIKTWLSGHKWLLWLMVFMAVIISLNTLYSVFYGTEQIKIFYHQLVYAVCGFFLAFLVSRYDYRIFRRHIYLFFLIAFSLLILVLIRGLKINGTTGWINLGLFSFQPVEIAKLVTILALSAFFAKYHNVIYSWKVLFFSFLIPLPFAALTLLQPDLGSTLALMGIWGGFIFASSAPKTQKIAIVLATVTLAVFGWLFLLKDYQRERLSTFVNPEKDALGTGYNTLQAVTAIGSGGIKGKGLGFGSQSQLHFLPEAHSDFIFAVFAEETGWIGVIIFLVASLLFYFAIINISSSSKDNFGYFLGVGTFWFFIIHFFVNVGMNLGILPIVGLPLPFLSAGGTNLFISFFLVGLIQSVGRLSQKTS